MYTNAYICRERERERERGGGEKKRESLNKELGNSYIFPILFSQLGIVLA